MDARNSTGFAEYRNRREKLPSLIKCVNLHLRERKRFICFQSKWKKGG